jgi:hypothetical protein
MTGRGVLEQRKKKKKKKKKKQQEYAPNETDQPFSAMYKRIKDNPRP